ncbi:hypothetical protein [Agromyces sp. Soil535]|uniref:hypothetical protein n=1 Tax=Agromyces sp. Soil535 TaxID=1736390 RepID=UPI0007015CD5|nr:hypothetical protein [Agromyces sp. Soil535]KRE28540.1 hypothetical protein ASG80_21120 [Agromyces sp. Soil535]
MDWVTWLVIAGVIVIAAVGVALWNRFGSRGSPVDRLDQDAAKSVRDAQANIESYQGPGGGDGIGG